MAEDWQLPENYVNEGLVLAESAKFMGLSLNTLSKEELIAVAAYGWKAYSDQISASIEQARFMRDIGKSVYQERK